MRHKRRPIHFVRPSLEKSMPMLQIRKMYKKSALILILTYVGIMYMMTYNGSSTTHRSVCQFINDVDLHITKDVMYQHISNHYIVKKFSTNLQIVAFVSGNKRAREYSIGDNSTSKIDSPLALITKRLSDSSTYSRWNPSGASSAFTMLRVCLTTFA